MSSFGPIIRDLPLAEIARCLGGNVSGSEVLAPGPGHSPQDRSLSVRPDTDAPGGFLVNSFSDDDPITCRDYVREKLGLDPWEPTPKGRNTAPRSSDQRRVAAEYIYQDADGAPKLRVTRFDPKGFSQSRPDGDGWRPGGIDQAERVPYQLPGLLEAIGRDATIYIVEGEKAADALIERGLPATCSPGGAGKWPDHFSATFADADVVVLPDNDDPGRRHATMVAKNLESVAKNVRVICLPGLPEKGDVYDWLEGGGDPDRIAELPPVPLSHALGDGDDGTGATGGELLRTYSLAEFRALDLPPREFLLSPIMPLRSLSMLYAQRGIGKTHVGLGIALAVATGGNFLRWSAPAPRRVLVVDGEMPAELLKERFDRLIATGGEPADGYFTILPMDRQDVGVSLDLSRADHQDRVDALLDGVELLILDNISTLVAGIENDAESWATMQPWLLSLRRRGVAVLIVAHAGRNGLPRGTSKREDVLDTAIALKRPDDYESTEGARFEVHLTKARGVFGTDAEPFDAKLEVRDGADQWSCRAISDPEFDQVSKLTEEGLSVRAIEDRTGISKSKVQRIQAKLKQGARE